MGGHLLAQVAQDVLALQGLQAVPQPARVPQGQVLGRAEDEVGGPLALLGHPVVRRVHLLVQVGPQRLQRPHQFAQGGRPIEAPLLVEQALRQRRIVDRHQQVAAALEVDAALFELAVQPLPAVEADADAEGEPALQPHVTEAELRVPEVVVVVQALGPLLAQLDQAVGVLAQAIGQARLDAAQQGQASRAALVLLGESEGDGFLVGVRAVEVQQRDTFRLGQPFGLAAKGLREVQGMVGVLLKEDALLVEVTLDAREPTPSVLDLLVGQDYGVVHARKQLRGQVRRIQGEDLVDIR